MHTDKLIQDLECEIAELRQIITKQNQEIARLNTNSDANKIPHYPVSFRR